MFFIALISINAMTNREKQIDRFEQPLQTVIKHYA
jgi:hypothetical protein